jgi:hypothetical protein
MATLTLFKVITWVSASQFWPFMDETANQLEAKPAENAASIMVGGKPEKVSDDELPF